jgi:hypothetical protein
VQQPCSNPGEYPEILRKSLAGKYRYLQEICNAGKCWENYRKRLLISRFEVRVLGGSLRKYLQIVENRKGPG